MNTEQISLICEDLDSRIKVYYRGTFALDNLLSEAETYLDISKDNIFIFNSQPSKYPGLHWLLLYISKHGETLTFFDSFAKPPEFYSQQLAYLINGLSANVKGPLRLAQFRIQSDSRLCGVYCIFVAHQLAIGERLEVALERFSPVNLRENDQRVLHWFTQQPYGFLLSPDCKGSNNTCLSYSELLNDGDF